MAESATQTQTAKPTTPPNGAASVTTTPAPVVNKIQEGAKVDASGRPLAAQTPPAPVEKPVPTEDTPTEPPAPPPAKDSQRFAAINQQTKKLFQERAQVKRDREAYLAEKAQHAGELKEAAELKALIADAARNPELLLKRVYGDKWYETLTNYVTADKQITPELVARDIDERFGKKVTALEKRLALEQKARIDAQKATTAQANIQAAETFSRSAIDFVQKNSEKFPLTVRTKGQWRVPDLIHKAFEANLKEYGEQYAVDNLVSVEDAAAAVEKHISEVEAPLYAPPTALKAPETTPAAKPSTPPVASEPALRSLNNDMAVSTPSSFYIGPQSDDEHVKRAQAAYRAHRSVQH